MWDTCTSYFGPKKFDRVGRGGQRRSKYGPEMGLAIIYFWPRSLLEAPKWVKGGPTFGKNSQMISFFFLRAYLRSQYSSHTQCCSSEEVSDFAILNILHRTLTTSQNRHYHHHQHNYSQMERSAGRKWIPFQLALLTVKLSARWAFVFFSFLFSQIIGFLRFQRLSLKCLYSRAKRCTPTLTLVWFAFAKKVGRKSSTNMCNHHCIRTIQRIVD